MSTTKTEKEIPETDNNPGQDEFNNIVEKEFSPGDELMMDERAKQGAEDDAKNQGDLSTADISSSEKSAGAQHENQVGAGYTGAGNSEGKKAKGRFSRRQKYAAGALIGMLCAGIVSLFLLLLPALRLEGYLATMNQRVFAAASNAVSERVQHHFNRYMINYVLKLEGCGNNVSIQCRAYYPGTGMAGSLFKAWKDAKIEEKLFDKYGIEIQSVKNPDYTNPNAQRFIIRDRWGNQQVLKNNDLISGRFTGGSRVLGNELKDYVYSQTRWYQVMERKSIRKYLLRKHGIRLWCFFACTQKDAIDNKILDSKTRLKYKLIERIVYPISPKYAYVLKCLIAGDCSRENLEKISLDRTPLSEADLKDIELMAKDGNLKISQYIIVKTLVTMGVERTTAQEVVSAIPIAGQIYLAASLLDAAHQAKEKIADGTLAKMAAEISAAQYVEYYSAMRSANDEMKAGKSKAEDVGALMNQFNSLQPAESSKLYQAYAYPDKPVNKLDSGADAKNPYLCSDGKPIAPDQYVCPEKTLNQRNFKIENFYNDNKEIIDKLDLWAKCWGYPEIFGYCPPPPLAIRPSTEIHAALVVTNWFINTTLGTALNLALSTLQKAPYVDSFIIWMKEATAKIINSIFQRVFPLPINPDPDSWGREKWDGLEAGAEISASEFNKGGYTDTGDSYGLGGQQLSAQDQVNSSLAYQDEMDYNYKHSSLIDRLASLDYPNSPASRLINSIPSSWSKLSSNATMFLLQPFRSMGAIWRPVHAATMTTDVNAFGVPRFGYKFNDPVFDSNEELYTPEYCDQMKQKWEASKTQDPVTGINLYSVTNPCLLEEVSVETASAVFTGDDSLGINDGGGGGGTCETTSEAGTPPANYKNAIIQYAPGRSKPGLCPTPPGAVPNDPSKQFFGQMANVDSGGNGIEKYLNSESEKGGYGIVWAGPGIYIAVKYRNPPSGGNTMWIPYKVSGSSTSGSGNSGSSSGSSTGVCTQFPNGRRWVGGPNAGKPC